MSGVTTPRASLARYGTDVYKGEPVCEVRGIIPISLRSVLSSTSMYKISLSKSRLSFPFRCQIRVYFICKTVNYIIINISSALYRKLMLYDDA